MRNPRTWVFKVGVFFCVVSAPAIRFELLTVPRFAGFTSCVWTVDPTIMLMAGFVKSYQVALSNLARSLGSQIVPEDIVLIQLTAGSINVETLTDFYLYSQGELFEEQLTCCLNTFVAPYAALLQLGAPRLLVRFKLLTIM